jgi:hypothetical protein
MKAHPSDSPKDLVPPREEPRGVMISFRLKPSDAKALQALADEAECGHTTLARLIVEKYIADHPRKGGR